MKKFFQFMGPKQNWTPVEVQKKFKFKQSDRWNLKQKIVKSVDSFQDDPLMARTLRNGYTFLACCRTENLSAVESDDDGLLVNFLNEYDEPYIWAPGRAFTLPKRNPLSKPTTDENFFEIQDLDFAKSNREEQINVKCAFTDLIMVVSFEEDSKVAILVNSCFFSLSKSRQVGRQSWINIHPLKTYSSWFKQAKPAPKSQTNETTNEPSGNSKSQSSRSERSESEIERSQSNRRESHLESEAGKKSRAGRKRKRESDVNNVRFGPDYIVIETEDRNQKFPIEPISNKMSYLSKQWIANSKEHREKQWNEIADQPLDIFERVRTDTAEGIRFFRFNECFPPPSQDAIEKEWGRLFPNSDFPKYTLFYIIFDSKRTNPYTGLLGVSLLK